MKNTICRTLLQKSPISLLISGVSILNLRRTPKAPARPEISKSNPVYFESSDHRKHFKCHPKPTLPVPLAEVSEWLYCERTSGCTLRCVRSLRLYPRSIQSPPKVCNQGYSTTRSNSNVLLEAVRQGSEDNPTREK